MKCIQFHSHDSRIHTAYRQVSAKQDKEIEMSGQMNSNTNRKRYGTATLQSFIDKN